MGQSVGSAIQLAPHLRPVAILRSVVHSTVAKVLGKDPGSDVWLQRQIRLVLERDPDRVAIPAVVGAASQLDEAPPVIAHAIAGLSVAKVATTFGLGPVRGPAKLVDRFECGRLHSHRGNRGDNSRLLADTLP